MSIFFACVHVCVTKTIVCLIRKEEKKALACAVDCLCVCVRVTVLSRTLS